jgi:23S rRNA (cytosine1962-C5)-methyltransferase
MRLLPDLPAPAKRRLAVRVIPAAERALRAGHPWLFDQSITDISHEGRPGDLAIVFDRKRRFLAIGLYDPLAPIRVRVLQHSRPATINEEWYRGRLAAAVALRARLPETDTTGYRLVHGENDGLSGLVVDRYDQTLVVKLYTTAWVSHLNDLLPALLAVAPAERLVLRMSRAMQERPEELHELHDGQILWGRSLAETVLFRENGLWFEVDVVAGQKTGFFLDQRENRARVEPLAAGERVLNVFAFSGGFSLYAARGGARQILSLDISRGALAAAERNFALNKGVAAVAAAKHETMAGDAFQTLAALVNRQTFGLLIIDPPSFAKSQTEVDGALAAYRRLVELGLAVLRSPGTLVMSSCSSRVTADQFFALVNETARSAGRPLQEMTRTGHPIDHPITFPEGAYLKCLFARVA